MNDFFEGLGIFAIIVFVVPIVIVVAILGNVFVGITDNFEFFKIVIWTLFVIVAIITILNGTFSAKEKPVGFMISSLGTILNAMVVHTFLRECTINLNQENHRIFSFLLTLILGGPFALSVMIVILMGTFWIIESVSD